MAAAIIPIATAAISALAPAIPTIVQWVEGLFGHSQATGQKDGDAKMQAVVSVLRAVLTSLANSGKIPSAPVVDPNLASTLAGAVEQVVQQLKASGQLGDLGNVVAGMANPVTYPGAQSQQPQPSSRPKYILSGTLEMMS